MQFARLGVSGLGFGLKALRFRVQGCSYFSDMATQQSAPSRPHGAWAVTILGQPLSVRGYITYIDHTGCTLLKSFSTRPTNPYARVSETGL